MRNLIVAIIVIIFSGTTAFSQSIDLGIKGGVNFSNIRNLKQLNLSYKSGFQAGIFAGVKFSDKIGIQADLLYSQQGSKFKSADGNFDFTYINIPVVLKYYLVGGEGFNFQIGPQFGYLLDSDLKVVYNGVEIKSNANDIDVSGVIGFGYDFYNRLRIEGRYHLGFTDVSSNPQAKGRHKYIAITFGYNLL